MRELPIHIQLKPESDKTLYEQIYEYIREEIKSGSLLRDEKLPSARYLAEYLQVSRTTVDMAYGQLVSEGYLEARPRQGYFVSAVEGLYAIDTYPQAADDRQREKSRQISGKYDFSPNAIDMHFSLMLHGRRSRRIFS